MSRPLRWEPVVHDEYPWIIPFWVEITGIPLHLWTIGNLKNIGKRLGHIDTVELSAGRMFIDVDTRRPLTFKRKIASPEGDEVWIQIHYERLFKYCKTCRMLTHEEALCPTKVTPLAVQGERSDVFSRVQLPANVESRQSLLRDKERESRYGRDGYGRRDRRSRSPLRERRADGGFMNDARVAYSRRDVSGDRNARQQGGKVRKLASEYTRQSSRYAPYGKQRPTVWREKERSPAREVYNADRSGSLAHGTHMRFTGVPSVHHSDDELVHKSSGKRIASQIVTPARHDNDDNVTKRPRVSPRLLTFSPTEKALPVDAQIIGALNGMEIVDPINTEEELHDQEMLAEIQEDDMLGEDLMDMEVGSTSNVQQVERVGDVNARVKLRTSSSYKSGGRSGFPLGLQNKKAGFFRRGSPLLPQSLERMEETT
ncbi:hypothetical protein IGI04_030048 [Brassica rapa subsp. trilocularis]|uniref:Zinc knuckle CX2CX4HX4C domain-containing protein n=1 Tax=Brassica rapa subsp. trilocularis TaxID=1813537 RepID=A0ABQ7LPN7_BRACM|nr:hypothetical protein IGI04_030048 [Brassica rapa subsp. trilocularis]